MKVLQLGPDNWADHYELPEEMKWEFNDFPPKKKHSYDVVIVNGENQLADEDWQKLQWLVDPYHVLYSPKTVDQLIPAARHFLKCQAAVPIQDDPQTVIDYLPRRYFFGQSGIRFLPSSLMPMMDRLSTYEMLDSGHVIFKTDTHGQWLSLGTYKMGLFLDPNKLIKLWLAYQAEGLAIRLRVFIQPAGGDGDPNESFILDASSPEELQLPIKMVDYNRYANISLEVKGAGTLKLGILHSRWGREGYGEFIAGGQRIVDLTTREDIAYFCNPGDLKPPLNVYFSGARSLEGFEAFPMFRDAKAPAILFTDMRLEVGQFYTTSHMEDEIKRVIKAYLKKLGFDESQLIMNGISMGTYPAIRLGAQLGAYAINVAKPLAGLGLIAQRGRLERPFGFETIFDIDNQLVDRLENEQLSQLDKNFWKDFNQCDLSKTRLFVAYMKDDDYDNQAIEHFRNSPAVARAREFASRGFAGHHNDDPSVNYWFANRLHQMLTHDFGRKE